jgi:hypothetical protein
MAGAVNLKIRRNRCAGDADVLKRATEFALGVDGPSKAFVFVQARAAEFERPGYRGSRALARREWPDRTGRFHLPGRVGNNQHGRVGNLFVRAHLLQAEFV